MKPLVNEWVEKAEGDFRVATQLFAMEDPIYDAVCFHAQQCVEKYLKAVLQDHDIAFPKTHDLVELLGLNERFVPELLPLEQEMDRLTTYSVETRYTGTSADEQLARTAVDLMTQARTILRRTLGLEC